jgi:hypothetical protein
METLSHYLSRELARNAAIAWLEANGVSFGPHRKIVIGRLGVMKGAEAGVESSAGKYWRLRLDFDPIKGPHYNAEFGKKGSVVKQAFTFPGNEKMLQNIARRQSPR